MFHDDMYGHVPQKRKPLATASLITGILSIILCSVIYLALPLGALAVIFAVLSHTEYKMPGKSRTGLICGLVGMIATIVVTVSAFYFVLTDSTARSYLDALMQMYTGDADFSLEEEIDNLMEQFNSTGEFLPIHPENDHVFPNELPNGNDHLPIEPGQEGGVFL